MKKVLRKEISYRYVIVADDKELNTFAIQEKNMSLAKTVASNIILHCSGKIPEYQVKFLEEFQHSIIGDDPDDDLMREVENYNLYLGRDEEPMTLEQLKQIIADDHKEIKKVAKKWNPKSVVELSEKPDLIEILKGMNGRQLNTLDRYLIEQFGGDMDSGLSADEVREQLDYFLKSEEFREGIPFLSDKPGHNG